MDVVLTEIMKNRFTAMAEEAATIGYRTAHTTFVKQTQDFQVALAKPSGEFFAYPTMTGVTSGSGQSIHAFTDAFLGNLEPGDVLISNDPFRTGGLVTHTMDIHLARPVFFEGRIICFAWAFVHASDIGGAVPGSISPDLYEIYQEGIRIRPTKLVRGGRLSDDIVNLLKDNSRIGEAVWGDLTAMMAAMRLLDQRAVELCTKVGLAVFERGIDDVLAYAERKAREVISRLKDGEYTFIDYLEGRDSEDAIHIHCRLTIAGDTARIDYSGSSPQVHAAFNFATASRSHPFLCLGLTNYIQTVEPSIPINGGILRPIFAFAPLGTVMNADMPAAMGNRWVTAMRVYDSLIGCLNQAIPDGIAACGSGQAGIIAASWVDQASGRSRVAVVEPFSGGSGGRVSADGVDATDTMIGYLKSTPIEHVEIETPLVIRRHELVPGRIGHGQYRGGAAVRIDIECRAPEATITVRGLDRFRFQPWGAFGGHPGHAGRAVLNREGTPTELGRIRVLTMREGDLLSMTSPSGGGFGNPVCRDPEFVLRDVLDQLITSEEAQAVYQVALCARSVDHDRTSQLRAGHHPSAKVWSIAHGPERMRYEAIWSADASTALAEAAMQIPSGIRRPVLEWSRIHLRETGESITPNAAREVVLARAAELGALP
jgi:N-methylhydantoinase B